MRRKITVFIIIGVCYLLQTTFFDTLSFASISPNLLIIVTSSFGFMRGRKEGLFIGFFCGLLLEIYFIMFLFRNRYDFNYYFLQLMIPELVYTMVITIFLYFIILKINQKLEAIEKRSASKFV